MPITTVINYCTNDYRFIGPNIDQCLKFSDEIIIPVCDHFLDGSIENQLLLNESYQLQQIDPRVKFSEFNWIGGQTPKFFHNMSRWIGFLQSTYDYILFLDADEIIDGDIMKNYLQTEEYKGYDVVTFECYWYFRDPIYRAYNTEQAGSLFKSTILSESLIFSDYERFQYRLMPQIHALNHFKPFNKVTSHHFSWVRTKEQMLRKVSGWGHFLDKDWVTCIHKEFEHQFNGTDFVHEYKYEIVDNIFKV
jgi:hypothetical protein